MIRTTIHCTNRMSVCFGLFECYQRSQCSCRALPSAASWLREKGRTEIMGPIDYSTNYVCGLLIDGFQFPPTILTAHNPQYYQDLIESCGFTKQRIGTRGGSLIRQKLWRSCGDSPLGLIHAVRPLFVRPILRIFAMRADGFVKFTIRLGKRTGVLFRSPKRRSSS